MRAHTLSPREARATASENAPVKAARPQQSAAALDCAQIE
jgi:hypothetical protein